MQGIVPCLWFNHNAEEAVNFYVSVFKDARILHVARYGHAASEALGQPEGTVMTLNFDSAARSSSPSTAAPASASRRPVPLMVNCDTQEEIDRFWGGPLRRRRGHAVPGRPRHGPLRRHLADRPRDPGRIRPDRRPPPPGPRQCRPCCRWSSSTSPRWSGRIEGSEAAEYRTPRVAWCREETGPG